MWRAVTTPGTVKNIPYNTKLFSQDNFNLALNNVCDANTTISLVGAWNDVRRIVRVEGDQVYYVLFPVKDGTAVVDYDEYLRSYLAPAQFQISLPKYVEKTRVDVSFQLVLNSIMTKINEGKSPILTLVNYGAAFHYQLLQKNCFKGV